MSSKKRFTVSNYLPMSLLHNLFSVFAYYTSLLRVRLALTIRGSFCVTTTTTMPRQYQEDYILCVIFVEKLLDVRKVLRPRPASTFRINYTQFHNLLCRAVSGYKLANDVGRTFTTLFKLMIVFVAEFANLNLIVFYNFRYTNELV